MLEIDFSGPWALLPNTDNVPYLLAAPAAWGPGIYLWTFLFNQAHRMNRIEAVGNSIAARHEEHLTAFLAGERTVYRAAELDAGTLPPAYTPADDRDACIAAHIVGFDPALGGIEEDSVTIHIDPHHARLRRTARHQGGDGGKILSRKQSFC